MSVTSVTTDKTVQTLGQIMEATLQMLSSSTDI